MIWGCMCQKCSKSYQNWSTDSNFFNQITEWSIANLIALDLCLICVQCFQMVVHQLFDVVFLFFAERFPMSFVFGRLKSENQWRTCKRRTIATCAFVLLYHITSSLCVILTMGFVVEFRQKVLASMVSRNHRHCNPRAFHSLLWFRPFCTKNCRFICWQSILCAILFRIFLRCTPYNFDVEYWLIGLKHSKHRWNCHEVGDICVMNRCFSHDNFGWFVYLINFIRVLVLIIQLIKIRLF